jgi:SnoaL-like domain
MDTNSVVTTLAAKQSITEAMYQYCRSLDRMDRALMGKVFHPDAAVEFPYFSGTWLEFVDWVWTSHVQFEIHSHQVTNILIEIAPDGASAESESYVTASLWMVDPVAEAADLTIPGHETRVGTSAGTEHHVKARYLDRWSLRAGRWGIDHRTCVTDLQTISPTRGLVGEGRRDESDPSYRSLIGTGVSS